MIDVIRAFFQYDFMTRALAAGTMLALCCALLGVCLVLRRYSMIGDGLSHVGFGAMAIALVMNAAPLAVALPVVMAAAYALLRINQNGGIKSDAAIAVISSAALAIGVVAISLGGGVNVDINGYMFGSILSVGGADVVICGVLLAVVGAAYLLFYGAIFSVTFDEAFARASGINVELYNAGMSLLTAATIVVGMRMMGVLLISSLIIFPALSAMRLWGSFKGVLIAACAISVACMFAGLCASYAFSLPTGASIVCANLITLIAAGVIGKIKKTP